MEMIAGPLHILMLEYLLSDAEQAETVLRNAGLNFTVLRVDSRESFELALVEFRPDIVLADYKLPSYNGCDALEYMRRNHPHIPVIIVTGSLGDEAAVELLKLGARDYVLKGGLARLAPAVTRALSEEHAIRNRKLAEGKYRMLFEDAMDGILLIDVEDGRIVECNNEFAIQAGRTPALLVKLSIWEILSPEQNELSRQRLLETVADGSGRGSDLKLQRPDGVIVPVEYTASLLNIGGKRFIQVISRDITERKLSEQALRDSEDKFRSITASAQDAILMMGPEGRISCWNAAAEKIFGYSAEEAMGRNLHNLLAPERFQAAHRTGYRRFLETGEGAAVGKTLELVALRKDGTEFPVELSLSATLIEGRWHAIGILRDITERKQAEIALQHANRALATLGAVNRNLVRATDESELLQSICEAIVRQRGYRMAVVGYVQHDPEKSIGIMAHAGFDEGYLAVAKFSWSETDERGMGPSGRAVRSGKSQVCQDIAHDPQYQPWRLDALKRGYLSSIALPLVNTEVFGVLNVYAEDADAFTVNEIALLEEMAGDLAFGVRMLHVRDERDLVLEKNRQQLAQLRDNLEDTVRAISIIVEMRDPYTAGHQARVADLAAAIARKIGLPDEQVHGIHLAGVVHDLGKIQIPAEILSKPGRLTEIEYSLIKIHSQAGYDILKDIDFPWPVAQMVLQHHERLDGSGYPQGLRGDQILLEARILSVADVVEAISSHRPYRPGLGIEAALDEIIRLRGSYYDPQVVDACVALFKEQGYVFSQ